MTERPILFSAPSVRAILDGRKTQTRRIMGGESPTCPDHGPDCSALKLERMAWGGWTDGWTGYRRCPYGDPGDLLWVREGFRYAVDDCGLVSGIIYRSDGSENWQLGNFGVNPNDSAVLRWRPSIHMPRWASRLTLSVTAIRAERLQDISEEDAEAEGVEPNRYACPDDSHLTHCYRKGFRQAWDTINAKRAPWVSNPWVWMVAFEVNQRC